MSIRRLHATPSNSSGSSIQYPQTQHSEKQFFVTFQNERNMIVLATLILFWNPSDFRLVGSKTHTGQIISMFIPIPFQMKVYFPFDRSISLNARLVLPKRVRLDLFLNFPHRSCTEKWKLFGRVHGSQQREPLKIKSSLSILGLRGVLRGSEEAPHDAEKRTSTSWAKKHDRMLGLQPQPVKHTLLHTDAVHFAPTPTEAGGFPVTPRYIIAMMCGRGEGLP